MATNLKLKTGTIGNYNNIATKENGTIYFATDTNGRAYIYLNGNNIVPKMADLRNGGLGADYSNSSTYPAYSVIMLGSDGKTTTTRAPAAGAFYTDAASNKPKFGTLPVAQGGLGLTSIAKGAILYGNTSSTTGAVATLSPGTNGYVLVSTGSAPTYVKPTMTWTNNGNSSTAGPIFNFTFNGTSIAGAAIPAATDSVSGIITTGSQTMTGEKTWMSATYASSIYPRISGNYSLGTSTNIWNTITAHHISFYDGNKNNIGTITHTDGTANSQGYSDLTLGNLKASGTAGNSKARLCLYGGGTGYSLINYVTTSVDAVHTLPATSGNVMISNTTSETSLDGIYQIPFYTSIDNNTMQLGYNSGYRLRLKSVEAGATTAGLSYLYLGNSSSIGDVDNLTGGIVLYGDQSGYTKILPNLANSTNSNILYLPAASGELVYHTEDSAQGGSGRLISVSAAGQIVADTSTDIASDIKLMYLKDGLLTPSAANVGANNQFVYLSNGTITASTCDYGTDGKSIVYFTNGTVAKSTVNVAGHKQLMYLGSGTLTASDADEGSGVKPVYLLDGVITASSSSVAKSTQLMYMSSGTLTASTADVGSATQPVYLLDGVVTAADAYSTLLTAFSGSDSASDNTASITVGGTTKTATIIGGVSNSWTNGTSAGPTLSTTVNGKAGTAVAIPSASYSYSGIITTGDQTVKGVKTFASGIKVAGSNSTTDCATFTYDASTDTLTVSFPS